MAFFGWIDLDIMSVQKHELRVALREQLNEAKAKARKLYLKSERLAWEMRRAEMDWDIQRLVVEGLEQKMRDFK